jgi:hypothetical protein
MKERFIITISPEWKRSVLYDTKLGKEFFIEEVSKVYEDPYTGEESSYDVRVVSVDTLVEILNGLDMPLWKNW